MASKTNVFAILSSDENAGDVLGDVLDNASRDSYHMGSCGKVWLVREPGWSLENLRKAIDKKIRAKYEEVPAFVVFEVKSKVDGYYYESLWNWLRAGNQDE